VEIEAVRERGVERLDEDAARFFRELAGAAMHGASWGCRLTIALGREPGQYNVPVRSIGAAD
jgi:hypothetical protein